MGILVQTEDGGDLHISNPYLALTSTRPLSELATDSSLPLPRLIFVKNGPVYYVTENRTVYIRTHELGPQLPDWVFKRLETIEWIFDQ
jgi:hypothetical protein